MEKVHGIIILATANILLHSVSSFQNTAANNEKCEKAKQALAPKVCPGYSCRDKCNTTHEALRRAGKTQMCDCDEECMQYSDCCPDFATQCPEMHSEAQRKYAGQILDTSCRSGVHVFEDYIYGTTPFRTSTTVRPSSSFWNFISHMNSNTAIVEDKEKGIMRFTYQMRDGNFEPDTNNLVWHDVLVLIVVHDTPPYNGHLDRMTLAMYNYTLLNKVGRPCESKQIYLRCPFCSLEVRWEHLCSSKSPQVNLNGTETEQEKETGVEECVEIDTKRGFISKRYSFATATLKRMPSQKMFRILSDELPWRDMLCSMVGNMDCKIITCAKDRMLSFDGRSCFIPNTVFIYVITTQKDTFKSTTESVVKVPVSPYLCLAIRQLFRDHKEWEIGRINIRSICTYHVKTSKSRTTGRTEGVNNSLGHDHSTTRSLKRNESNDYPLGISEAFQLLDAKANLFFEIDNIFGVQICMETMSSEETVCHNGSSQLGSETTTWSSDKNRERDGVKDETCYNRDSRCFTHEIPKTLNKDLAKTDEQVSSDASTRECFHNLNAKCGILIFLFCRLMFAF